MSTGWQVLPKIRRCSPCTRRCCTRGRSCTSAATSTTGTSTWRIELDHTRLFDCETLQVEPAPSPTTDVFCAGHAMLGDGRLLVAGGTESFPHEMETMHEGFTGLRDTWIFRPGSGDLGARRRPVP